MKEQRTERIEARIKPSLTRKIEKAMTVRNYRSKSAYFEDALIFFSQVPRGLSEAELRKILEVKI